MHTKILSEEQKKLLSLIQLFKNDFYLVGGTAIALQIGHRQSIDFDLFTLKKIKHGKIKSTIALNSIFKPEFIFEASDQLHLKINNVKITFFQFPYDIPSSVAFNKYIAMPSLVDLAAMKAFAFAERAKWKDYVDMYFFLKQYFNLNEICQRTNQLFNINGSVVFTEKLFRQQLCYFADIDYSEQVEFISPPISNEEIKSFLINIATQPF